MITNLNGTVLAALIIFTTITGISFIRKKKFTLKDILSMSFGIYVIGNLLILLYQFLILPEGKITIDGFFNFAIPIGIMTLIYMLSEKIWQN